MASSSRLALSKLEFAVRAMVANKRKTFGVHWSRELLSNAVSYSTDYYLMHDDLNTFGCLFHLTEQTTTTLLVWSQHHLKLLQTVVQSRGVFVFICAHKKTS